MIRSAKKYRQGAASFYVVAFSTLILVVISMSFAAVIISELTRTSDDDLAQSAYDSALAGIEDAKLAYYNYQRCMEQEVRAKEPDGVAPLTCNEIVYIMNHPDCDMVAKMIGRIGEKDTAEDGVVIRETNNGEDVMKQAYTCVMMETEVNDYRSTLDSSNTTRVIQANIDGDASNVKTIKVSWHSESDGNTYAYTNFKSGSGVQFPPLTTDAATPPTISVCLVQTSGSFFLDDFDKTDTANNRTNRGTVYLVPTDSLTGAASSKTPNNYIGACKSTNNHYNSCSDEANYVNWITAAQIVKSNDKTVKNLPYAVYCPPNSDSVFTCSATLELPKPYGEEGRNNSTFMIVVSIPYGQPSTDIAVEFCGDDAGCTKEIVQADGTTTTPTMKTAAQVSIDSTGRTNDLYRRIEARIDTNDSYFPYPLYGIELLGADGSSSLLKKNFAVTCEYNFDPTCN